MIRQFFSCAFNNRYCVLRGVFIDSSQFLHLLIFFFSYPPAVLTVYNKSDQLVSTMNVRREETDLISDTVRSGRKRMRGGGVGVLDAEQLEREM